jgi:hypothetical protein
MSHTPETDPRSLISRQGAVSWKIRLIAAQRPDRTGTIANARPTPHPLTAGQGLIAAP